jgi:hypothetical protein
MFTWRGGTTSTDFPTKNALQVLYGGSGDGFVAKFGGFCEAHFLPPLNESMLNTVQKGRVIPVKITIVCGTTPVTGLTPGIQLLKGDVSPANESGVDPVETLSSSAADTTGLMRPIDGGYIYNLQVPSTTTVKAGDLFTIRVRPFAEANPSGSIYVVLKISK